VLNNNKGMIACSEYCKDIVKVASLPAVVFNTSLVALDEDCHCDSRELKDAKVEPELSLSNI
jgi:hypothetical protein